MGLYPRKSRCGARSRGREISVAKAISFGHIGPRRADAKFYKAPGGLECGCSSGVEHNLAKVRVVGSNPIARSKILFFGKRLRSKGQTQVWPFVASRECVGSKDRTRAERTVGALRAQKFAG